MQRTSFLMEYDWGLGSLQQSNTLTKYCIPVTFLKEKTDNYDCFRFFRNGVKSKISVYNYEADFPFIERRQYMDKLRSAIGTPDIKVITGACVKIGLNQEKPYK